MIRFILFANYVFHHAASVNLTNFPATRIYINPDHYSVEELQRQ